MIRKLNVNFKIYDFTEWATNNYNVHELSNILRSKGNQIMKFGQLIEYNKRNIFLEKLYTKCGGEVSPRNFYKKSKLSEKIKNVSTF